MGDFVGLDDLMTEDPRVTSGMIGIFGDWIDRFGIDGFRVDTARHVDPHFWQQFVPAMQARARVKGVPHFHIFGEVAVETIDTGPLAWHAWEGGFPAALDFAFRQAALESVAGSGATAIWERMLAGDGLYRDGEATARQLPTFISNHDAGRFATFVRRAFPQAGNAEVLIAFNTPAVPVKSAQVEADSRSSHFTTLAGAECAISTSAPGSLAVSLPPLSYSVYAARSAPSQ